MNQPQLELREVLSTIVHGTASFSDLTSAPTRRLEGIGSIVRTLPRSIGYTGLLGIHDIERTLTQTPEYAFDERAIGIGAEASLRLSKLHGSALPLQFYVQGTRDYDKAT